MVLVITVLHREAYDHQTAEGHLLLMLCCEIIDGTELCQNASSFKYFMIQGWHLDDLMEVIIPRILITLKRYSFTKSD